MQRAGRVHAVPNHMNDGWNFCTFTDRDSRRGLIFTFIFIHINLITLFIPLKNKE
jgi:hypothetical protein